MRKQFLTGAILVSLILQILPQRAFAEELLSNVEAPSVSEDSGASAPLQEDHASLDPIAPELTQDPIETPDESLQQTEAPTDPILSTDATESELESAPIIQENPSTEAILAPATPIDTAPKDETIETIQIVDQGETEVSSAVSPTLPEEEPSTEVDLAEEAEEESILQFTDDKTNEDAFKDFTAVVRQSQDYTCGPAALATLLVQLGENTQEQDVLEKITEISPEKGVSMLSLKNAAILLDQIPIAKKWSAEQAIAYITTVGDPILIHDQKPNVGGHYSVLREYNPETKEVTLSDTEAGNIKYSLEDFEHIFTGYVLIITNEEPHELLLGETDNVSDSELQEVYGKYVPVYMAISSADAQTTKDIKTFKSCINAAMKNNVRATRDTEREKCYRNFGAALSGEGLSLSEEWSLAENYYEVINNTHESSIGYVTLKRVLDIILEYQGNFLEAEKSYIKKANTLGLTSKQIESSIQIAKKLKEKINQESINLRVLNLDIESTTAVVDKLNTEISKGYFEYNGVQIKLGSVESELTSSTATYENLSQNLKKKLQKIETQILGKLEEKTQVEKDKKALYAVYQETYNEYYKLVLLKSPTWKQKAKIDYLNLKLSFQETSLLEMDEEIKDIEADLRNLSDKYKNEQQKVKDAKSNQEALKKKQEFGKAEIKRKKTLLETKTNDLSYLKTQKQITEELIKSYEKTYAKDAEKFDAVLEMESEKKVMEDMKTKITAIASAYGYSKINERNTEETEKYLAEELAFIEKNDDLIFEIATAEVEDAGRETSSLVISLFPGVGEGYDIYTLLEGADPITGEELTPFTKTLTFAGLLSGAGSGKAARTLGMEALGKLAKDLGVSNDELSLVAESVSKNYKIESIDDVAALKDKLSISSFMDEIKVAAKDIIKVSASTVADFTVKLDVNAWAKTWSERGFIIDSALGNNLGKTFQGVDILIDKTVTSIKSLDTTAKSYQDSKKLYSKVKGYLDQLKEAQKFGNLKVGKDFDTKAFKLAIPDAQLTSAQADALKEIKTYAKSIDIQIEIVIVTSI